MTQVHRATQTVFGVVNAVHTRSYRPHMTAILDRRSVVVADDGTPLAVREIGSRAAPVTVVFAHGFCLHMGAWAPQRIRLAHAWAGRARLVFFDHRGHGGSGEGPVESYTITQLGHDLDAVIRAVAPHGPLILVGHSMGGMAVLSYIASHRATAGQRLAGLSLIATAAGDIAGSGIGRFLKTPAVPVLRAAAELAPTWLQRGWDLARRLLAPVIGTTCPFPMAQSPVAQAASMSYDMIHRTPIATLTRLLVEFKDFDENRALPLCASIPVSIVCGTHDKVTPILHSHRLASALPTAELVEVPGARHMVELERPDIVSASLDRLLGRVEASQSAGFPSPVLSVGA